MEQSNATEKSSASTMQDFYEFKIKKLYKYFIHEKLSFWGVCLYLFFEYVRPQSIYPALDVAPFGKISLVIAIFGVIVDPTIKWVKSPFNIVLTFFFIVIILSGFTAFLPARTWDKLDVFLNWFLFYFLCILVVNTEKRFFIFMLLFMLCSFKMSQHGFVNWAQRGFSFAGFGLVGAPGWFKNSGEFAIQMVIFACASAAFVLALKEHWGKYTKAFFYLMPITASFSVMGASSRGSQLALAVVSILLVMRSKQRFKALLAIAVLGGLLFYFLPDEQMSRFREMGEDETSVQRIMYWNIAIDTTKKYPLLGVGYENWIPYMNNRYPEGIGPLAKVELPHNIFLQASAELGFIGAAVFLLLIVVVLSINYKTRKLTAKLQDKYFYYLALGLDCGLVGYLVAGFFVTVLYYPFFWVQAALSVALHNVVRKKIKQMKKREKQELQELDAV